MYNQRHEYGEHEETHKNTYRFYRQEYNHHIDKLFLYGMIFLFVMAGFMFLIWRSGPGGEIFVGCVVVTIVVLIGFRLYVWIAGHSHELRKQKINSYVIETQHVSVYDFGDGSFRNFTAEVAAAALPQPQDEPMAQEFNPRHEEWEEQKDRAVYNSKVHDKMTWEKVAEHHNIGVGAARSAHDRHKGRLTRGETQDSR
jgi:hypothetical protein